MIDDGRWWVLGAGLVIGAAGGLRSGSGVRLGPLLRDKRSWQPIVPGPSERTNRQNLRLAVWLQQSPVGTEVSDATGTYGHAGRWDHDDREPVSDGWRRIERATDRWAERVSEGRLADTIDAWRADPGTVDPPILGSAAMHQGSAEEAVRYEMLPHHELPGLWIVVDTRTGWVMGGSSRGLTEGAARAMIGRLEAPESPEGPIRRTPWR